MEKTILILQAAPSASITTVSGPTDEVLMSLIQERDEEALTKLYYRHRELLLSTIGRVVGDPQQQEDILQEVFREIWNRAEQYSAEKGRALGWIVTVARQCARKASAAMELSHLAA